MLKLGDEGPASARQLFLWQNSLMRPRRPSSDHAVLEQIAQDHPIQIHCRVVHLFLTRVSCPLPPPPPFPQAPLLEMVQKQ